MKNKLMIGIIGALLFIVGAILIAGYIKFNIKNDDIYIQTSSGNGVKYNDIIKIQTSIIPLASLTNYIGGDFVEVKSIVPAGVSPHGFDIKPEQMIELQKADVVIYLDLEHIDGFLNKALENKDKLIVSEGIQLIQGDSHEHEEEENHNEEEHHEEETHSLDPHIWTSSINALVMAEKITKKLSELHPENKTYFENNLVSLREELKTIKDDFVATTQGKKVKEFIIFHDAYNYLFDELSIDMTKKLVFQKTVLSDPNSAEMKELIDAIKVHKIKFAFKEPQFNDSNLQKLASEYNLTIDILNPLGTDSSKNGYIQNYKDNLLKLQKIYE
ncbi:zinc ABC transporter substrate-binding protein [Candidatus Gracilibacteria bacterium]|nr:zinc ABC transporter substrate-binding protein [Candidatus Gracilibacteria bacterium]NUJ98402.1 zinc ABC transporter substrate-binding protein [Candidatus Gracilibacteria bacterium]